jgi:hypothetical protein
MVQIIERPKSFGERVAGGLVAAGDRAPSIYDQYVRDQERRQKQSASSDKALATRSKNFRKSSDEYLERFHPGIYENEGRYNRFNEIASKYVDQGLSDDEVIRSTLNELSDKKKSPKELLGEPSRGDGTFQGLKQSIRGPDESHKIVGGALGRFLEPAVESVKQNPSVVAKELPVALAKSQQNLEAFHDPGTGLLTGLAKTLFPDKFNRKDEQGRPLKPNTIENMLAGHLRKGLSEKEKEGAERVSDIESVLLDLAIPLPGLKGAPKGAAGLTEGAAKTAAELAEKTPMRQGATLSEAIFDDLFKKTGDRVASQRLAKEGLGKGQIAKELPKGATASRIERVGPEGKLFKRAEEEAVRAKQLKLHPEYAEEIAKDAAERAARIEAKRPKTPMGEASVAKRMAMAEAELPKAKEMYQKAVARVRSLENEIAKGVLPEHSAQTEALYNMAVQELNDSEFFLKTVLNNAKTGEARIGVEGMRQAARNKMINLENQIAEGKTPELSLKDYNPEFIKRAKELQRKKPLPSTRHDDYFTQVHEGYANEYRNRIAALSRPADPKSLSSLGYPKDPEKTKKYLQKLVDHIEAENTIHRHKMALREIEQRKIAQDRLGKFTKQAGEQRVKDLAKEALKSPEKAAEAADAAFEEVASRTKNQVERDRILKEREFVKKKLQQEATNMQQGVGLGKSTQEASAGASTPKEAAQKSNVFVRDLKEVLESLKGGGKNFFKTKIGKDFLVGVSSEVFTQVSKGEDWLVSPSTLIALAGRRGGVYRYLFSQLTREIWHRGLKSEYKKALRDSDDEKLIQLKKKMQPKLVKEATREYRDESSF